MVSAMFMAAANVRRAVHIHCRLLSAHAGMALFMAAAFLSRSRYQHDRRGVSAARFMLSRFGMTRVAFARRYDRSRY